MRSGVPCGLGLNWSTLGSVPKYILGNFVACNFQSDFFLPLKLIKNLLELPAVRFECLQDCGIKILGHGAPTAALYENQGVPVLTRTDIFASATEHAEPVATWLSDHPPQSLSRCVGGASYTLMTPGVRFVSLAVDDMMAEPAFQAVIGGGQPVRLFPVVDNVYTTSLGSYPDYSDALSVKTELRHASLSSMDVITVRNGFLIVNMGKLNAANAKQMTVALFDYLGRIVGQWNVPAAQTHALPLSAKLTHGAYIARIICGSTMIVRTVAIR